MINMEKQLMKAYEDDRKSPEDIRFFPEDYMTMDVTKAVLAFRTNSIKLAREAISEAVGVYVRAVCGKMKESTEHNAICRIRQLQKVADISVMFS